MRVSYVWSYSNDDVAMTIRHIVSGVGVGHTEVADVERRVSDGAGIIACTEKLSNLVPSCVLADFINCECVTATVYLKSHLASLKNSDFFRREVVELIRAWVGRTADRSSLKTRWRPYRSQRQHAEINRGVRYGGMFMCNVTLSFSALWERREWKSRDDRNHKNQFYPGLLTGHMFVFLQSELSSSLAGKNGVGPTFQGV